MPKFSPVEDQILSLCLLFFFLPNNGYVTPPWDTSIGSFPLKFLVHGTAPSDCVLVEFFRPCHIYIFLFNFIIHESVLVSGSNDMRKTQEKNKNPYERGCHQLASRLPSPPASTSGGASAPPISTHLARPVVNSTLGICSFRNIEGDSRTCLLDRR